MSKLHKEYQKWLEEKEKESLNNEPEKWEKEPTQKNSKPDLGSTIVIAVVVVFVFIIVFVASYENSPPSENKKSSVSTSESTYSANSRISKYNAGELDLMAELHANVFVEMSIGDVGLLGMKKGLIVEIHNKNDVGVITSLKLEYTAIDPFGGDISSGELLVTDVSISPNTSARKAYEITNFFTGNPLEKAETMSFKILQIKWSNGVIT